MVGDSYDAGDCMNCMVVACRRIMDAGGWAAGGVTVMLPVIA